MVAVLVVAAALALPSAGIGVCPASVTAVTGGAHGLTDREVEVLLLISRSASIASLAQRLLIPTTTSHIPPRGDTSSTRAKSQL
jgi:hypothetical protein